MTQGNGRRKPQRDARAAAIDEFASLVADVAKAVAAHADDIIAWADRRRAKRDEGKG